MLGLDEWLAAHGGGGTTALLVAILLGLRHATDPDHLTAVSTLVLADRREGTRRAGQLGLAWGLGHATTLLVCGLPVVLFRRYLPEVVQRLAEILVGALIVALSARLLVRWRGGVFHAHRHHHGEVEHSHPHVHERGADGPLVEHRHAHAEALGRSPLAAFGIGLVHGVGGSAAVGILLASAVAGRTRAVVALVLFAAATAASMALLSTALGCALTRAPWSRRLARFTPAFGLAGLLFGCWYALDAARLLPPWL
ncbi:MAG: hypothetical protein U0X73_18725 [Thermoanaerobaculia bacterium]